MSPTSAGGVTTEGKARTISSGGERGGGGRLTGYGRGRETSRERIRQRGTKSKRADTPSRAEEGRTAKARLSNPAVRELMENEAYAREALSFLRKADVGKVKARILDTG